MPGLTDLLGVGDSDIEDACVEFECSTLNGIMPVMSKHGGLTTHGKQTDLELAACAILKADWGLGTENRGAKLDFGVLCDLACRFDTSTVSGRVKWDVENAQAGRSVVECVTGHIPPGGEQKLEQSRITNLFHALNKDERLGGGRDPWSCTGPRRQ